MFFFAKGVEWLANKTCTLVVVSPASHVAARPPSEQEGKAGSDILEERASRGNRRVGRETRVSSKSRNRARHNVCLDMMGLQFLWDNFFSLSMVGGGSWIFGGYGVSAIEGICMNGPNTLVKLGPAGSITHDATQYSAFSIHSLRNSEGKNKLSLLIP